jgi:uncharacterized protein
MREVVEVLVKGLVDNPDQVDVVEEPGDRPGEVRVSVRVAREDAGKVIGRQGKIANALRTVARAAGNRYDQRVVVDIDTDD